MGKFKKKRIEFYVIKSADIYNHILFMTQNFNDIVNYLSEEPEDIIKGLNTGRKFGKYRVGTLTLKYADYELIGL